MDSFNEAERAWLEEISVHELKDEDIARSKAYAYDLERGLAILRTFSQGITVFGSARLKEDDKYYIKARELGRLAAENGHTILTGGGPGIMEAANRGSYEYGGRSVGFNIILDHEQHANPYLTDSLEFKYFFARKVMLAMGSKAYVFFPGGFGTLDEMSEILCLVQTRKMPKVPMFFFGKSFWRPLEKFFKTKMIPTGVINPADMKLYTVTDDVNEIIRAVNKLGHVKIDENIYDKKSVSELI